MRLLLTTTLLFCTTFLMAQEKYRIQYDYKTDNFEYFKLDKSYEVIDTLNNPRFKRNSLIEIKLLNVNPFAINIKTDIQEEEIHATGSGGYNFSNLLGGISSMTDGNLKLNVTKLPDNIDDQYVNKEIFGETTSRSTAIENKFSQLNALSSNVDALKRTLLANLTNPNLDKATILNNIRKVAAIQTDIRIADPNENFHVYISSLKKIVNEDSNSIVFNVNELKNELAIKSDNEKSTLSLGELRGQNTTYSYLESLLVKLEESSNWTTENLNKIEALYTSLEASSFEQTYDYEITADKVNLELKFVQSEFANELDDDVSTTTIKTRHVKLFSKGGFKINTSIALTLNNFKSKSYDYFIDENGIIGSEKNDYFTPNLSTLINFYPVISENFNLGGSFGVSIPIAEGISGINYLFGPSLILGNKSRLALSGGLAFGPVRKLTNGLQVGDSTTLNDVNSFTKNVYDFGFYFGVSFNVFNLK
ncbi:hypothetical protein [Flavobacterium saliperosum]|uniref:Outer membrane protein beta-barrel domain-containing protein n=2 Tax=Flavobacterium saliperosum TaxID=329186 RepID=A0A1G4VGX4_9FLAO|nr:hypothetical protein [Flavobacterium saliperosum]SCX06640.1 hypothetical protein SAMN02927925_01036 [Flavobacterium saliperosum]